MTRREIALASALLLVLAVAGAPRLARGAPASAVRPVPALGGGVCAPGTVRATPMILIAGAEASAPALSAGSADGRARRGRYVQPCIALASPPAAGPVSIPRQK